jgi:hypothetical protein
LEPEKPAVPPTGPGKLPAAALTTPIASPLPTPKPVGSTDQPTPPADGDASFVPGGTVVIPPLKVAPGTR